MFTSWYPGLVSPLPEGRKWIFSDYWDSHFFCLIWVPKTQHIEPSAVRMPFKMAPDSTHHYGTLKPTIKNHSHSQQYSTQGWRVSGQHALHLNHTASLSFHFPQKVYLWYVESSLAIKWHPPPPSCLFGGEPLSLSEQVDIAPTTDPESEMFGL